MAWDEWEQLKAEAARKQEARTRLDSVPPGGGNPGVGDLQANQQDLAAIGDKAFKLWQRLGTDGGHAEASVEKAAGDLTGQSFLLGGALSTTQKQWRRQLQSLLDACAQISNHLDYTQKAHQGDEFYIAGQLSSIATLDKGFGERS
ncbi:hypothetical protein [Streptomyces sp. NPDC050560]|uniref:hypothetical protein n=1 Tax=Streptomyces sp. NPDC050560 TaxID=3365630 RepID=UPI003799FB68